jgi:hypothetical protein
MSKQRMDADSMFTFLLILLLFGTSLFAAWEHVWKYLLFSVPTLLMSIKTFWYKGGANGMDYLTKTGFYGE